MWSHSNQGAILFSHEVKGHPMVVGWPAYPSKSILGVVKKSLLTVDPFVQYLWTHPTGLHNILSCEDPYDPQYGPRSCCEGTRRCGPWFQDWLGKMMQNVMILAQEWERRIELVHWTCPKQSALQCIIELSRISPISRFNTVSLRDDWWPRIVSCVCVCMCFWGYVEWNFGNDYCC